jgi:hypothetical protein
MTQTLADSAQKTTLANYGEKQRLNELGLKGETDLQGQENENQKAFYNALAQLSGRKRIIGSESEGGGSEAGIDIGQILGAWLQSG